MYLPIYNEYVGGCVNSASFEDSNGTMITRNLETVAFEYSASTGDGVSTTSIDRINALRELQCTTFYDNSFNEQTVQDDEWVFLFEQQLDLIYQVDALSECLDVTQIQADYPLAATTATGGNVTNLLSVTSQAHFCNQTFNILEDGTFKCENVEVCEIQCAGPNNQIIESSVFDAGCTGEHFLHSMLLQACMSVITFVLLNISRIVVMRGLVRYFFRHLANNKYQYLGSCYSDGNLIYPEKVTKEFWSMKKTIQTEIKKTLTRYQRSGALIILFGICVNIPWIVLLEHLAVNLKFVS